ncbi:MAG: hypothetical protein CVU52_05790, partial [Deltaproteobacteria bacterium HGW-Deltaproteobacteria-10]
GQRHRHRRQHHRKQRSQTQEALRAFEQVANLRPGVIEALDLLAATEARLGPALEAGHRRRLAGQVQPVACPAAGLQQAGSRQIGEIDQQLLLQSVDSMTRLNKTAAELIMENGSIHACTDITGFGFLGHACEMIEGSNVGLRINSAIVPVFNGLQKIVEEGFIPGGLYRNKNFRIDQIEARDSCPAWLLDVFFDPQTAGGLFFSLPAEQASSLVGKMHSAGIGDAAIVGEVVSDHPGRIFVY